MLITKTWKLYQKDQLSGVAGFDVSGVETGMQAEQAPGIPKFNETYPEFPNSFRCSGVVVTRPSFTLWRVVCSFAVPVDGNEHPPDQPENKLLELPRIFWQIGGTDAPVETDADGAPLLNSAGEPFDPQLMRMVNTVWLTIQRYEGAPFDVQRALYFSNTVNDAPVTFQGMIIDAGQIRCVSINPVNDYTTDSIWIDTAYHFELRADGFKWRVKDEGANGFIEDSGVMKTPIFTPEKSRLGFALLDGTGKPRDTSLKGMRLTSEGVALARPVLGDLVANPDRKSVV